MGAQLRDMWVLVHPLRRGALPARSPVATPASALMHRWSRIACHSAAAEAWPKSDPLLLSRRPLETLLDGGAAGSLLLLLLATARPAVFRMGVAIVFCFCFWCCSGRGAGGWGVAILAM